MKESIRINLNWFIFWFFNFKDAFASRSWFPQESEWNAVVNPKSLGITFLFTFALMVWEKSWRLKYYKRFLFWEKKKERKKKAPLCWKQMTMAAKWICKLNSDLYSLWGIVPVQRLKITKYSHLIILKISRNTGSYKIEIERTANE